MSSKEKPTNRQDAFDYLTYGARLNAEEIEALLRHLLKQNAKGRVTPLCIWGMHGIGKTQMVREFAEANGCDFAYVAPAQFEEMGDLLGMPRIDDSGRRTRFAPPEWVPQAEGPGIFLIDDVNRADDRILRGIMQLLQNYALASWALPPKWMIVLTANPDGGDYSVTPLDDAMITRMLHVTMDFDLPTWARWAERSGIDSRGIDFVLAYPELVQGARTTPRTLVQFFDTIASIQDLRARLPLVRTLAEATLDRETAAAFTNFVNLRLGQLVTPEEILNAADFNEVQSRIEENIEGPARRLDVLSVLITRLTNSLLYRHAKLTEDQFENLRRFLLLPFIPNDLRLRMAQELIKSEREDLQKLYAVPEIGRLLLEKM